MKDYLNEKINELLSNLTSAYQEQALQSTLDDIKDYDDVERFCNDACAEYRDILKGAGFSDQTGKHSVYKGFEMFGDETELDGIAREIYDLCKNPVAIAKLKQGKKIIENQQESEAIAYALYLVREKQKSAVSMIKDCPQNKYIEEWKSEEKSQTRRANVLERLGDKLAKECDKLFDELHELESNPNKVKYYDTFWGHKVSDYALENGRLDYATLSKCFDAVLCNYILDVDPYIYENVESGDLCSYYYDGEEITCEEYEAKEEELDQAEEEADEDEEKLAEINEERRKLERCENEVFQWFIVSHNALDLLKEAGELVLYSDKLDCYIWGVTHWGTSWDYVLTSIKLKEREDD